MKRLPSSFFLLTFLCGLLAIAPVLAGCSSQPMAQAVTTTPEATITAAGEASPTTAPAVTVEPEFTATVALTGTPEATPEGTPTVEGTSTPRPTPGGTPPADPMSILNIRAFYDPGDILVSRDRVNLDGSGVDEVLFTVTAPRETITSEARSAFGVLVYDPVYFEWNLAWATPLTGTASPLPAASQALLGGFNGGDLLRTGNAILAARITTIDSRAHLHLWQWDSQNHLATPLRMVPAGGGEERDAVFDADLDVNVVDLNDDGLHEVVADNLSGVQVWRWDGGKFVPEGGR